MNGEANTSESMNPGCRPHPAVCIDEVTREGDTLTIVLEGQINYDSASALQSYLADQFQRHHPRELVLDCQSITFIDSQGLAVLLAMLRTCKSSEASFALRAPSEDVKRLLMLTKLDQLIAIV
jgi:anti-sigma B factor antagonist